MLLFLATSVSNVGFLYGGIFNIGFFFMFTGQTRTCERISIVSKPLKKY